ncbi:hypothetical protein BKA63DRAFT_607352 [Paraphoma chrysanthemicola]|nr:hypothetical protein BKA63DRAFT_607352 [Paraphoma chrysanthemicola]
MYTCINPQVQTKLFAAPTEIRHAIYRHLIPKRIHLALRDASFRLSPCVQRADDDDPDCTSRTRYDGRHDMGKQTSEPLYPYRLSSSWGEHWRCEENMHEARESDDTLDVRALIRVCKLMFIDIAEMLADTVVFHINDMGSLEPMKYWTNLEVPAADRSPSATSNFIGCTLPNVKNLEISLRIPPDRYNALENPDEVTTFTIAWNGLQRLSPPSTWSILNEKTLLSPFNRLNELLTLNLTIVLSKLHPKHQTPERHFVDDRTPMGVLIHRRYRQRWYGTESTNGVSEVHHAPDFPILYELSDLWDMSMDEIEQLERDEWKWSDPERFWEDLYPTVCTMGPI